MDGSTVAPVKADLAAVAGLCRCGQAADGFDERGKLFVVGADADVKFGEFGGKGLVVDQQLAQADKGTYDLHAHHDRLGRVEHAGCHQRPVLSESPWKFSPAAMRCGRNHHRLR